MLYNYVQVAQTVRQRAKQNDRYICSEFEKLQKDNQSGRQMKERQTDKITYTVPKIRNIYIPRNETGRPRSQFLHLSIWD
jgi:hypothetical protein